MVTTESKVPKNSTAALVLADGTVFYGRGIGHKNTIFGEICFNTGLTGYQEILTDLSYAGQIITFTFPHIGNIGANDEDKESKVPVARGLVVREDITSPSNFRSQSHFNDWLIKNKLTGICGVDTRALTRHIRTAGAQNAAICFFEKKPELNIKALLKKLAAYPTLKGLELAEGVSCKNSFDWTQNKWKLETGHGEV